MVIDLYTQELINDLRTKSHYEVSNIADVEARYRAEAGSEKMEEIKRCISESLDRLRHICWRFLKMETGEDQFANLDIQRFELNFSERRAIGKDRSLKEAMHTFVVEYALSKFYCDVRLMDYCEKHDALATNAAERITDLLFSKLPPRV